MLGPCSRVLSRGSFQEGAGWEGGGVSRLGEGKHLSVSYIFWMTSVSWRVKRDGGGWAKVYSQGRREEEDAEGG